MLKLAIGVLASAALGLSLVACGPDGDTGDGAGLRRNGPPSTPPTTTEHRLPRIPLPHITLPGELRSPESGATEGAGPDTPAVPDIPSGAGGSPLSGTAGAQVSSTVSSPVPGKIGPPQ